MFWTLGLVSSVRALAGSGTLLDTKPAVQKHDKESLFPYWSTILEFFFKFFRALYSIMHANNSIMHGKSPSWIIDYLEQNGHFSKYKKLLCHWVIEKVIQFIKRHILSSFFLIRSFFLLWFYFWWNWVVSKHFCDCRYPF